MNTSQSTNMLETLKLLGANISPNTPTNFSDIKDDSREVSAGDLFILRQGAIPLTPKMAEKFIDDAIKNGANAIVCDPSYPTPGTVGRITLKDPHLHLSQLAQSFYGNPTHNMKVIAITGTNGKTTTSFIIESLAQAMGLRVGVLGTISHRYPGYSEESINTTPGALKLYRLLKHMKEAEVDLLVMEVSSHGLALDRVDGLLFDIGIWTNFGRDHLDFHETLEEYANAKCRLFNHYLPLAYDAKKKPCAIYNAADPLIHEKFNQLLDPKAWGEQITHYSMVAEHPADIQLTHANWQQSHWKVEIDVKGQSYAFTLPLVGKHNVDNTLAAIAALYALGHPLKDLCSHCQNIEQIPGRLEIIDHQLDPQVLIDFAHTPEALKQALLAVDQCHRYPESQLWVVFGAGGDRDKSKRPIMGNVSSMLADFCLITNDNPRSEVPYSIIEDIEDGFNKGSRGLLLIEPDRHRAINYAIQRCQPEDTILIAGKGHETYQIIGDEKLPFDDKAIALNALKERNQPRRNDDGRA